MSQDIVNPCLASSITSGVCSSSSFVRRVEGFDRAGFAAEWLVVPVRVEGQVADDLAGVGVDDGDVQVVDEHAHDAAIVLVA